MKWYNYFKVASWSIFNRYRCLLFYYYKQIGMSDKYAYQDAKKHNRKYTKNLAKALLSDGKVKGKR